MFFPTLLFSYKKFQNFIAKETSKISEKIKQKIDK